MYASNYTQDILEQIASQEYQDWLKEEQALRQQEAWELQQERNRAQQREFEERAGSGAVTYG